MVSGFTVNDCNVRYMVDNAQTSLVDDLKVYWVTQAGGCCNLFHPEVFSTLEFYPEYPLFGIEDGGQRYRGILGL